MLAISKLADRTSCTACGACVQSCPVNSIFFEEDEYGCAYPIIDEKRCIDCGKCRTVCHVHGERSYHFPLHAYAGWSLDEPTHEKAASGGIASEIYKYCVRNNLFTMGTYFNKEKRLIFKPIIDMQDIKWARNSKYVQSDMSGCFEMYEKVLKQGDQAVFIGLPCQVAAIKSYLRTSVVNMAKLVTVDLLCRGVPPINYWKNHMSNLEEKYGQIDKVSFRGPDSIYTLRCFLKDDTIVYEKDMHGDDTYYRAFCENLNFRENCYHCSFARYERVSDITLGDYSGIGQLWPYEGRRDMVSLILSNTNKGNDFLEKIQDIELIERHICEPPAAKGNPPLRHPSDSRRREVFLTTYKKNGGGIDGYEKAAKKALRREFFKWKIELPAYKIVRLIKRNIPRDFKKIIKQFLQYI